MSEGIFIAITVACVDDGHGAGARGFSQASRIPKDQRSRSACVVSPSNGFDLSAVRAACLQLGTGHFPSDCHRRGLSSHSRPVIPFLPMAGDRGRFTSSRNARTFHSSGDGSAAASATRFSGRKPVRCPNFAGGFGLRPFSAEA